MRLEKLVNYIKKKEYRYQYTEEFDCASLDWEAKGLKFHVWEFPDGGAESNVRSTGRMEEFEGDFESQILQILIENEGKSH